MTEHFQATELLRAANPATNFEIDNARLDQIINRVVAIQAPTRRSILRTWKMKSASAVVAVGAATALIFGFLPGTSPLSAAAATLHRAARADSAATALATLAPGQYYYQEAHVAITCVYTTTSASGAGESMTYVSEGTLQNWTSANGAVETTVTPTVMDEGGSHFATSADQSTWIAAGRPFIACPFAQHSATDGTGQGTTTIELDDWGFAQRFAKLSFLSQGHGGELPFDFFNLTSDQLVQLPASVSQIAALLANGQITPWGLVLDTPQVCPTTSNPQLPPVKGQAPTSATTQTGCDATQQLAIIEQLLQFPDAAQKLGSVLYNIAAQTPGSQVTPYVTDSFGVTGSLLTVPLTSFAGSGTNSGADVLEILLDPTSGALLSTTVVSSGIATSNGVSTSAIGYGPVGVVNGIGAVPSTTNG
jgi:hypothetical protein